MKSSEVTLPAGLALLFTSCCYKPTQHPDKDEALKNSNPGLMDTSGGSTYRSGGIGYDAFRVDGWGDRQIIVFPGLNMVVVFTGANYATGVPCDQIVERYILASLQ